MAGTLGRIGHELTKERDWHNPFLDGLLDPTVTMIYVFLGEEQEADRRLISSPYRPYNPRQEGSDPSTIQAYFYTLGQVVSYIPYISLLLINNGLRVKYGPELKVKYARDSLVAEDVL